MRLLSQAETRAVGKLPTLSRQAHPSFHEALHSPLHQNSCVLKILRVNALENWLAFLFGGSQLNERKTAHGGEDRRRERKNIWGTDCRRGTGHHGLFPVTSIKENPVSDTPEMILCLGLKIATFIYHHRFFSAAVLTYVRHL